MNQISEKQFGEAEKQFKQFEAMINSMTPQERSNPDLLAKVRCAPLGLPFVLIALESVQLAEAQRSQGSLPFLFLCAARLMTKQYGVSGAWGRQADGEINRQVDVHR